MPGLRHLRKEFRPHREQADRHRRGGRLLLHGLDLDRQGEGYSSRTSNAAYCVADESTDAFRRLHATLYAELPQEGVGSFADNSRLIEVAEQSGSAGAEVSDCINNGTYTEMATGLAKATSVTSTPTVRINGREYTPTRTEGLVSEIKEIVGNVPGL